MIVADVLEVTVRLVTVNVALVAPAAIVTVEGTVAADVLLLATETAAPPAGAALVNVTVACEVAPPTTEEGLKPTLESVAAAGAPAVTVSVAERATSYDAVMVAAVVFATAKVVMANVADVCPAGIVTMPGGLATERLLVDNVTDRPPAGAGVRSVTVPVALVPPATLVGAIASDCNSGGAFGSGAT